MGNYRPSVLGHDSCYDASEEYFCIQITIALVQGKTGRNFVMAKKTTYEELEQRVKELEKEVVERKLLEESVNLLSTAVKTNVDAIGVLRLLLMVSSYIVMKAF